MHFKLVTFSNNLCTIGKWYQGDEVICVTMEKPWLDNQNDISCVPAGTYDLRPRLSPIQGETYYLENADLGVTLDTPNTRTYIQIDKANMASELLGCIAVGVRFGLLRNKQGIKELAVLSSKVAKEKLMKILNGENHTLTIERY